MVGLRALGVPVSILYRVSLPNVKAKAMLLLQTYLCNIKYLTYEPGYFAYVLE